MNKISTFNPSDSPVSGHLHVIRKGLFVEKKLEVLVWMEDEGPMALRGNKWHKLKYNLEEAVRQNKKTLLTFGGAFSNHVAATALASKMYGFKSIGIIRGERTAVPNKTLQEAAANGMLLYYETREKYRIKTDPAYIRELRERFGDFYLVPEGGSNELAVKGCREISRLIDKPFDYICCACGTGATLAGLICGLNGKQHAVGISVLKAGSYFEQQIKQWLNGENISDESWEIINGYNFGGYAKSNPMLMHFITEFNRVQGIQLEPVYTGKLFYALYDLAKKDFFKPGSVILALHTGGLQYLEPVMEVH